MATFPGPHDSTRPNPESLDGVVRKVRTSDRDLFGIRARHFGQKFAGIEFRGGRRVRHDRVSPVRARTTERRHKGNRVQNPPALVRQIGHRGPTVKITPYRRRSRTRLLLRAQQVADSMPRFMGTSLKRDPDVPWLKEAPSQPLQQALKDLTQSCRKVTDERRRGREAHVPKPVRRAGKRPVPSKCQARRGVGDLEAAGVRRTAEARRRRVPPLPYHPRGRGRRPSDGPRGMRQVVRLPRRPRDCERSRYSTPRSLGADDASMLGLDLGVRHFAVSYDGVDSSFYDIPAPVKKKLRRLGNRIRHLQSVRSAKMERKAFGSAYRKLCMRIRKLWLKVRRIRLDFIHKLTSHMAESQRHAAVEALEVRRMTRSDGARKRDLNHSILEQGYPYLTYKVRWGTLWHLFRTLLRYKLERRGRRLVEVNPAFTSVTCSICGDRSKSNRDGERFRCTACDAFPYGNASPLRGGHEDHADANASKNIWAAGQAVLRGTILAPAGSRAGTLLHLPAPAGTGAGIPRF